MGSHNQLNKILYWLREPTLLKVKLVKVPYTLRKSITVENFKFAHFMSNSVTPSIDESVRLPQQALQQSDTQESPMFP